MNLTVFHRTMEYDIKAELRNHVRKHGSTDGFTGIYGSEYFSTVTQLAGNIYNYVSTTKGEKEARNYLSTSTLDFE